MPESVSVTKPAPKSRRSFTEEFKREAVRLAQERGNVAAVARDLGVAESCLARWKDRLERPQSEGSVPFPGQGTPRDAELAKRRRELARVKEENEILKKAVGIFTKPSA